MQEKCTNCEHFKEEKYVDEVYREGVCLNPETQRYMTKTWGWRYCEGFEKSSFVAGDDSMKNRVEKHRTDVEDLKIQVRRLQEVVNYLVKIHDTYLNKRHLKAIRGIAHGECLSVDAWAWAGKKDDLKEE